VTHRLVIQPIILYLLLALGGVGVGLSLPGWRGQRGRGVQIVGGVIAASAAGLVVLALSWAAYPHLPNLFFYVFGILALAAGLRMISHPRPVYAALYFILTILASAGLFVLLSAEFLAFALIIVYAGAILITYLFVIMLATQMPTHEDDEALAQYDAVAREPAIATAVGFVLLGVLTTMVFRGVPQLPTVTAPSFGDERLVELPGRIQTGLRNAGLIASEEYILRDEATGLLAIAISSRGSDEDGVWVAGGEFGRRFVPRREWPTDIGVTNIEGVGFELLAGHPGAIEIAGVILLMAMLGAVVLARKQVEMDEAAKEQHAASLAAEVRRSEVRR
jgi:NADH-quinone oxidoreductase subunit J